MTVVINQLQPFNEVRFDLAMAYLSHKHRRALTQYDMVKLHVMADVYHTLKYGRPIIGGAMERWPNGPVVKEAYHRLRDWADTWSMGDPQPSESFRILGCEGKKFFFEPLEAVDEDDLSEAEKWALEKAWDCVASMGWDDSQEYFHRGSFIGRAWMAAGATGRPIDWNQIIDEYQRTDPQFDVADALKAIIAL